MVVGCVIAAIVAEMVLKRRVIMLGTLRCSGAGEKLITAVYYAGPTSYGSYFSGLSAIPPERVGLQGEYEYYGLAHRIQALFQDYMGKKEDANIVVKQRGSAIILTGSVSKAELLNDLIDLAMATEGVTQLEVYNILIQPKQGERSTLAVEL